MPETSPIRFRALSAYFRDHFGHRVQKIALDAGSTCPNRDGTLSIHGCLFCNSQGSGTGEARNGVDLRRQYFQQREHYLQRSKHVRFMAYFQSFSNTYGPPERLRQLIHMLEDLPDLVGVALGTRPDCLDLEKLEILNELNVAERWLELGLQSAKDRTLKRINRGHDAATFALWATRAAAQGLKICAHVITGLPGEGLADFEQTIAFVNNLPVSGIKIHNLYVSKYAPLASAWTAGDLHLLTREESLEWLIRGITLLRPDIIIHRINADPSDKELLAPAWAKDKHAFLRDANALLKTRDIHQGMAWSPVQ